MFVNSLTNQNEPFRFEFKKEEIRFFLKFNF